MKPTYIGLAKYKENKCVKGGNHAINRIHSPPIYALYVY